MILIAIAFLLLVSLFFLLMINKLDQRIQAGNFNDERLDKHVIIISWFLALLTFLFWYSGYSDAAFIFGNLCVIALFTLIVTRV